MSITSRCNGCGATSLGGVLNHMPSCPAQKPKLITGGIMPAVTITFDNPEEATQFIENLKQSRGSAATEAKE